MNLGHFFDLSSDVQCVISRTGTLIAVNAAFSEASGYAAYEVINTAFHHYVPSADREVWREETTDEPPVNTIKTGKSRLIHKNGKAVTLTWQLTRMDDDCTYAVGTVLTSGSSTDSSHNGAPARQRTTSHAMNLPENLQLYKDFFEMSNDLLSVIRINDGFYMINSAFCTRLGYTEEEIMNVPFSTLIHPEDRSLVRLAKEDLERGHVIQDFESRFRCKNGRYKWLRCNAVPASDDLMYMVATDITEKKKNELKQRELLTNTITLNHELELYNTELTRQEEAIRQSYQEIRKQNRKLERVLKELADKNFELDQFVYRTSHDIRSPLATILGIINLTKLETDEQQIRKYITIIEERTHKLDGFTRSVFNYSVSSRSRRKSEKVHLEDRITEAFSNMEYHKLFPLIDRQVSIESDGVEFYSDKLRVSVVLSNLISNAVKFQDTAKPHHFIQVHVQVTPQMAYIRITDNGIGIEDQYIGQVYDMFFRASERSDGSGLGLYIVRQTMERLGGTIEVSSRVGEGTTFQVSLPNKFKGLVLPS